MVGLVYTSDLNSAATRIEGSTPSTPTKFLFPPGELMKRILAQSSILGMTKEPSRGVFWIIDGEVLSFPFYNDIYSPGVSKSGLTYNHKNLWPQVKPKGCNKPYNYYPRGRVELGLKYPTIYVNPNFDKCDLAQVKTDFELRDEPRVIIDTSPHYRCYLDAGWVPAR